MLNYQIYNINPKNRKLENQGVTDVNSSSEEILRYELETFVCDGQYAKGMEHVLHTFLDNLSKPEQPAVWISGFYGSGKSHLVKMMGVLWKDYEFKDHTTARSIAVLPAEIKSLYTELSTQGRRQGGLHSAIGTLSAGAYDSVRLLILSIIFKSIGLPSNYSQAKFILWLRKTGIENEVREHVEAAGGNWLEEIENMYVADTLHEALVAVRSNTFSSTQSCADALGNMFPNKSDVSNDELTQTIQDALSNNGKMPLTLLVLDEMQQFIGSDTDKALRVQEAVQACSKSMGGKLLVVATGQTAVTGTACLSKIEGRFTIRIELSDTDIDAVIRKVILAKKPETIKDIECVVRQNIGEVTRHLAGSILAHRQDDDKTFAADYPILPTRRRFWERTLQVLDQTGTDSQLRNQLTMNLKMIQENADCALGTVSPGDYLFFDLAEKLLQNRILPRPTYEAVMPWYRTGSADEKLKARACGLIFLINKLVSGNKDIGLKATLDTLADLLVEDLNKGSTELRAKLPKLLDGCHLLMKIRDEYRIQTPESTEWTNEFLSQQNILKQDSYRTEAERDNRMREAFSSEFRVTQIMQGKSKIARQISIAFNQSSLPSDAGKSITLWMRDGWHTDENSVKAEARQAGLTSPVIFGFIPKRAVDELRHQIVEFKAASATLDLKGTPGTPEGMEARSAMVSIRDQADVKIADLLRDILGGTILYQAGGSEVSGLMLQEKILEAAKNAAVRLFPNFDIADEPDWGKVYEKAHQGAPDALKILGDNGEAKDNSVCKHLISFLGAGKTGAQIRDHFSASPYGWPKDSIEGALQVLLVSGALVARNVSGVTIDATKLERKNIGTTNFKLESVVISATQKIALRKLFQKLNLTVQAEELPGKAAEFLDRLESLARSAGGDAPRPEMPSLDFLAELRQAGGNEQLMLIFNQREELETNIVLWLDLKEQISARLDNWEILVRLEQHAAGIAEAEPYVAQISAIRAQRLLLHEPDMVLPLIKNLTALYRTRLNDLNERYESVKKSGEESLESDANWKQLTPDIRHSIRLNAGLLPYELDINIHLTTAMDILNTLQVLSFAGFGDKLAALPGRYQRALRLSAEELEPEVQHPDLPSRMLKTDADIDAWLQETEKLLKAMLKHGPIQM